MSDLTYKTEQNTLTLFPAGRIDSANAAAVEKDILASLASTPHDEVVMDLENLSYISSAGLRVVLRLRKAEPTLKLINVSSEVYEIFDMTGFTEIVPVEKAYRRLSVEGCEAIGAGANGKVYRLDPDTIIKVYNNPDSLPDIRRERELARRAFVLGIPTAIPYDVVRVGESYGSVFELLNADSFGRLIRDDPEHVDKYITLYVDLLKKIHSTVVRPEDMPDEREVVIGWAKFVGKYLPAEKAEKLLKMVEDVPEDLHMLHGDYHIKNVMMQSGEVLLIDMDTLCHGHPIFELASVFNAYQGFSAPDHTAVERFLGIPFDTAAYIWRRTLALYLGTEDEKRINEVANKAALIGYTRLLRRTVRRGDLNDPAVKKEYDVYLENVLALLDQVDTLLF